MSGVCDSLALDRLTAFPAALADIDVRDIRQVFPQPTLIQVTGRREPPLFVSTLLHGNETTSFSVLQDLARLAAIGPPPRSLMVFVGAVRAAEQGARIAPGGVDFNRVWAGGSGPEAAIAAEVAEAARAAAPFASIDIHNTTGANPHYACVSRLDAASLGLAALFSRVIVHYENPPTTQSIAFSRFCPATTIECGRSGDEAGRARATQFVLDVAHARALPTRPPRAHDIDLYQTIGRIELPAGARIAFGAPAEVEFAPDLDALNFSDLPAGAALAQVRSPHRSLKVFDERRRDITERFLTHDDGAVRLAQPATPAMLTTDAQIMREDCVGYLMARKAWRPAAPP